MEGLIPVESIVRKIYLIRGQKVMLDSDLASFYDIGTKVLNQAVKRNADRFPEDFMFQLDEKESVSLRSQIVTSNGKEISVTKRGGRTYRPYAFTEHGVVMLSSVIKSPKAALVSIAVVRAFIKIERVRPCFSIHKYNGMIAGQVKENRKEKGSGLT